MGSREWVEECNIGSGGVGVKCRLQNVGIRKIGVSYESGMLGFVCREYDVESMS